MCDVWKSPTNPREEINLNIIEKLPKMFFTNITGGEPFLRQDLPDLVTAIRKKTKQIVISTNGYFTDRIISLSKKYPDLGIRVSLEGLPKTNNGIRKIPHGFDRGIRTLLKLRSMGVKNIGFGMTVQDMNYMDLIPLYQLSKALGYEFATASLHNSHYFHKLDNVIKLKEPVIKEFNKLITELLKSNRIKDWFRAYFNHGLINYIQGNKRELPCKMGREGFFLDPYGDILPCNGMDIKQPMGNLYKQSWDEIWQSKQAQTVRDSVNSCNKNCWMIGSAAPAIRHHPIKPILWILKRKLGIK
jgi:MoaA/NifB/PqqE/SkfB family radical SAM enzyme